MTDKKFEKLIKRCVALEVTRLGLLSLIEEEYERRFGFNPSDIDDDFWIDTVLYARGDINFNVLVREAKNAADRERKRRKTGLE